MQLSKASTLNQVLGKYWKHHVIASGGNQFAGIDDDEMYAAVPKWNSNIVLTYDFCDHSLKVTAA
jgi:hypothetical protein